MYKKIKTTGVTLIEIMIVITIIGILSTIILPHMIRSRYNAQLTACQVNIRHLATAILTYETQYKRYPDTLNDLKTTDVLQALPICPSDHKVYVYQVDDKRSNFTVYCGGNLHDILLPQVDAGHPLYSPASGMRLKAPK
jgi:prepilin-type N-terminal cleavage/methylation domain-containing protein